MDIKDDRRNGVDLPVERRTLFRMAGIAAAGLASPSSSVFGNQVIGAATLAPGKDNRLIVLSTKPMVLGTPLELLDRSRTTPTPLLFVRNNQPIPEAAKPDPPSLKGWKIEFVGAGDRSSWIDAYELATMDQVKREMVLQCSGNSRRLYARAVKSSGTQWGRGGMGNVRIGGVPLSAVLRRLGIEPDKAAKYLTAEGKDDPYANKKDFEHSIPLDVALERSILALRLNGAPIPAIHGGPVRLITPGYFGTMNIKWLGRLRFEKSETDNYNQIPRYRVPRVPIKPGEKITYTFENSKPNYDMKVKSVILVPAPNARFDTGKVRVSGVAFNDGKAPIEAVLVSSDRGESWRSAKIERSPSPYAWDRWSIELSLPTGAHQLWSRAVDALGRSQPLDGTIHWNPAGYEWNGVEKIDITVG